MARALMITYYFPPIGGPGVYRSLKFCKYLSQYGWHSTVIAGDRDDPDFAPDDTLLSEIPAEIQVHRLSFPKRTQWRRTRKWLFDHRLGRIGHWLGFFFDFPCRFREWSDVALRHAEELIGHERPNVIYTSAPPFSAHLVGMKLKQRFGIPWVADFRDPWVGNPILMKGFPKWQLARQMDLEQKVAHAADRCVFAHPRVAEEFAVRHNLPSDRVVVITNGFDPDDFPEKAASIKSPGSRIEIVHVGSFYGDYSPAPLERALRLASGREPELLEKVKLLFIGGCPMPFNDIPGLEVEVLPRVSHFEAIYQMQKADVLLVVFPKVMGVHHIPGKLFEYLAVHKPILAVIPENGSAAEILRQSGAGIIVDPDEPDAIIDALKKCLISVQDPHSCICPSHAEIAQYSRTELTRRLADVFGQATATRTPCTWLP